MSAAMSVGMMKPPPEGATPGEFSAFGVDHKAFGTPGAGGSFAFCDPTAEMAFAYVMNRCGQYIVDDPRQYALMIKAYECAQRAAEKAGLPAFSIESLRTPHYLAGRDMAGKLKHLAPLNSYTIPSD